VSYWQAIAMHVLDMLGENRVSCDYYEKEKGTHYANAQYFSIAGVPRLLGVPA
jgi:hypothetical protein